MEDDFTNSQGQTQNGGHWHETTFGIELMTPQIDASQFAPLSRMTVAALRDMGYTVDLGYADPFALGSTPTASRDDRSGNYNTTTTIAMNSSLTGSVELVEDNDWFRVSLTAGSALHVQVERERDWRRKPSPTPSWR